MTNKADRIKASFLLGACGDALGAPLEPIFSLKTIRDTYGEDGLSDIIAFKNAFETGVDYPAGRVTDDTTMAMTTAAAIVVAMRDSHPHNYNFKNVMRDALWQGFLNWGQHQDGAAAIKAKIDAAVEWPDAVKPFWFHCGAGRGTIAALLQDEASAVGRTVHFNMVVRGRKTASPNAGCGGMMRVAPIGLLPDLSAEKIFELAAESAALTNAHPDAYVAAGVTALLVHFAARGWDPDLSVMWTRKVMQAFASREGYKDGIDACRQAIDAATLAAIKTPGSLDVIDALPGQIGCKNKFLAVPVLAQVVYAVYSAGHLQKTADVKAAMVLAVNHSGDSDSVGAIVGNIIGARTGTSLLPQEWVSALTQKAEIEAMAHLYAAAVDTPPPAKPGNNPPPTGTIKKPGI